MLADLSRGQLSHVDPDAFEIGVNIATTPGKVIHETGLYQLIHYAPATKDVFTVPLVIFPPWINRFYILDLNHRKASSNGRSSRDCRCSRSEEHTSELQSLMRISYAVFCLKKKKQAATSTHMSPEPNK